MKQAYTLLETILTLALLGLLVGLAVMNATGTRSRANSKALATELSLVFQAARQQARAENTFVAVCFPSQNGTVPVTASYYLLEGHENPRVTRVRTFSQSYSAAIFVGHWPTDPASLRQPGSSFNLRETGPTTVSDWLPSPPRDAMFVFTPSGSLITNDLPQLEGQYHLLVSDGLEFQAAGPPPGPVTATPGPGYFQLRRATKPYTVSLSPNGSVSIVSGVRGGIPTLIGEASRPGVLALPPPVTALGANQDPTVVEVEFLPEPNAAFTVGLDALVDRESHLLIRTHCDDPDGEPLACEWTMRRDSGGDPGRFSVASGGVQMLWDGSERRWTSNWTWAPPLDGVAGERFTGELRVWDPRGGVAPGSALAQLDIELTARGKIVYADRSSGTHVIHTIYPDGSGERALTPPALECSAPALTRDGSSIVFLADGFEASSYEPGREYAT